MVVVILELYGSDGETGCGGDFCRREDGWLSCWHLGVLARPGEMREWS